MGGRVQVASIAHCAAEQRVLYLRSDSHSQGVAVGCRECLSILELLQGNLCVQHRCGKDVVHTAAQCSQVPTHSRHQWIQALQDSQRRNKSEVMLVTHASRWDAKCWQHPHMQLLEAGTVESM